MGVEVVTKEDLQIFRMQLLDDLKRLLTVSPQKNEPQEWLKSSEARKILKASPGTMQNLRISGKLNPVKISGSWRYSLAEINALFKSGK
ncbi:helix-turn-helix domain-containing protein [Mucilaginibacter boryungensis]|uniref:Helix-turn-helix domain-containing protein n=1 Tax=Mucilaginibacter boryungensis TaxID=768480 RepID=A0ABR9XLK6_9SPHI|nr:helix-turn-helix domain-containing protein [Mucilaginibacter boryungensis]MBE9668161.1 helix-turn-helix domain-containing protein [Mucilaginibacter boryungensis]